MIRRREISTQTLDFVYPRLSPHLITVEVNSEGTRAISVHSNREPHLFLSYGQLVPQFFAQVSKLWDLNTGECLDILDHGDTPFNWLRMASPDGSQFLSASADLTGLMDAADSSERPQRKYEIKIWDFIPRTIPKRAGYNAKKEERTGHVLDVTLFFHSSFRNIEVEISSDGTKALFCCKDYDDNENPVEFWDLSEKRLIQKFKIGKGGLPLQIKPNKEGLKALIYNGLWLNNKVEDPFAIPKLWDLEAGKVISTLSFDHACRVVNLVVSADETRLYGYLQGPIEPLTKKTTTLWEWNLPDLSQSPRLVHTFLNNPSSLPGLAVTPDGMNGITWTDSNQLCIWNSAPLPHERIANVYSCSLAQNDPSLPVPEYEALPSSIKRFVEGFQTTDVSGQSSLQISSEV